MKLFGFGKDAPVELAKDAKIEVGGKKFDLAEVVNSITALEAEKAKVSTTAVDGVLGEKDEIEVNGKKYTGLEVANAIAAAAAKKIPSAEPKTEVKKEPTLAEFLNSEDGKKAMVSAIKENFEALKGEGFFNGIEAIARQRGGALEPQPKARATERERVAEGRKRFGRKVAA